MSVDVLVPQMGESVLEGTILEWKVKVGERVKRDQPLVELMTDKVNVEIPAETEGILTHQYAKEGEVVPVGTRIATIDDGGPAVPAKGPGTAAVVPSKAPVTSSGTSAAPPPVKGTAEMGRGKMSPKVKMLVREYSVDPASIIPTGKDGLVTVDDVMRTVEARAAVAGFAPGAVSAPPPAAALTAAIAGQVAAQPPTPRVKVVIPVFEPLPESKRETRLPLAGIRKLISDHMVKSIRTASHVTTFEDIDMTQLAAYRSQAKVAFRETYGVNLTYLPFIVKAACIALKEFPTINASITDTEIIIKSYYHIGIAVARDEGLIVPVIRDADKKSVVELAVEMAQLGEKARNNRLTPNDVSGGTFSVTNAGMFGATASTPIINQPQVAILGVHAIAKRPWVVDNSIGIRDISTFCLSFDHRLIDGHTAVKFLHRIHEYLADPRKLLMHLR
ncbi:MAG TPA: dihydrolipoamide acetyltransferase family protein [Candidatus Deferrimicrobium sp.]|nr:dihydrolipoamide acetyltransferase family protein [Candidatus Deferrimicrobium sp.]